MSIPFTEETIRNRVLTVGSLFSGIGGLDLGLERTGRFKVAWQVEIDPFCKRVLAKHWPNVTRHDDVCSVGSHNLSTVDLLVGGFPCQDISYAGNQVGITGERSGLWKEFLRIICELRPRFVLIENVKALLSGGDWNETCSCTSEPTMVCSSCKQGDLGNSTENNVYQSWMGVVLGDLAEAGYDAEWHVLSAAQFGAPHLRERVFIVAHSTDGRREKRTDTEWVYNQFNSSGAVANTNSDRCGNRQDQQERLIEREGETNISLYGISKSLANTNSPGRQERNAATITANQGYPAWRTYASGGEGPFKSGVGRNPYGIPTRVDRSGGVPWPAGAGEQQFKWEPPRVITEKIPHRRARLAALGNAVIPQITQYIGYYIAMLNDMMEETYA